jgi:glycosyltransferase involved in cell wall biosynthesis
LGLLVKNSLEKPRLLIVLNRFVIGGQAVDTLPLAYFLKQDFDILIVYGEKEKDEIEPVFLLNKYTGLHLKKVGYLRRSVNPFIDIIAFFQLLLIIIKFKPHIVHTHGAKSGFLGRLSAWVCQVPVIVHTFHGHFFHSYFSRKVSGLIALIERAIGRITTAAVALSKLQKKELVEDFKILPANKMAIIPLGFAYEDNNDKQPLRNKFRTQYKLQQSDVAVGIVGRIVPVKNHSLFVQCIKVLLSSDVCPKPAFFIVGDGELRRRVEEELRANHLSYSDKEITEKSRVVFTSWLTDMVEVMNGLDIIALTSLNEGTPLSIIEAQFFKKAVVATDVGGVKDTMEDGATGFLVKSNDTNAFSAKLELLIRDEALRVNVGEAGYKLASERFSKQKEVSNTKNFYFSLLQRKPLQPNFNS